MSEKPFKLVKLTTIDGFAYGISSPVLLAQLDIRELATSVLEQVYAGLIAAVIPDADEEIKELEGKSPVECLLFWLCRLHQAAELAVFQNGIVISRAGEQCLLALPTPLGAVQATVEALEWLMAQFNQGCVLEPEKMITRLQAFDIHARYVPLFLKASFQKGIQASLLAGTVIQYGQGKHACRLDGTFTENTSRIATVLARDKMAAVKLLGQSGLPVPRQAKVNSVAEAVNVAEKFGYPVVVKPFDLDGGVGVFPGLMSSNEVRGAYLAAQKHSSNILLEKHVEGRDYRLVVFQGKLIWATERRPACVVGDGIRSIKVLIEAENCNPLRSGNKQSKLKKLVLDKEALAILQRLKLTPDSIPGNGNIIPLRRKANVNAGGLPVPVLADDVHPDNRDLAIRAVSALGLDLAGVDLLIPDISQSWKETEAAICEVNAQPGLGNLHTRHLYGEILEALVPNQGRVPIIVVLAPVPGLVDSIGSRLCQSGINAGWEDGDEVYVGGNLIAKATNKKYPLGQALILNKEVEAAVIGVNDATVLQTGLAFDRFDVLVLAGSQLSQLATSCVEAKATLHMVLRLILPGCRKSVIATAETLSLADEWAHFFSASGIRQIVVEKDDLAERALASLGLGSQDHARQSKVNDSAGLCGIEFVAQYPANNPHADEPVLVARLSINGNVPELEKACSQLRLGYPDWISDHKISGSGTLVQRVGSVVVQWALGLINQGQVKSGAAGLIEDMATISGQTTGEHVYVYLSSRNQIVSRNALELALKVLVLAGSDVPFETEILQPILDQFRSMSQSLT